MSKTIVSVKIPKDASDRETLYVMENIEKRLHDDRPVALPYGWSLDRIEIPGTDWMMVVMGCVLVLMGVVVSLFIVGFLVKAFGL